jgi:ribosomal-protein-alanine N-acetyltransferase
MIQDTTSPDQTKSYVRMFLEHKLEEPRRYVRFVVILKEDNQLIGECGINMPNLQHSEGEIVYRFAKSHWGNGFASEAVGRMVNFGFQELKLHRIEALCDARNTASIRVLEKLGMTREGCMREHRYVKGHWRSSVLYSILEQEFDMKR